MRLKLLACTQIVFLLVFGTLIDDHIDPFEAKPCQIAHDRIDMLLLGAIGVKVFDAQHHLIGNERRDKGREDIADMEPSRRARCKTTAKMRPFHLISFCDR